MAEEEEQSEATLILKILNAEGLKDMRFLGKMKSFVVAWVDPRLKRSTKTLTSTSTSPNWYYELFFPLTLQTLQNPNSSCITIQILSPPSSIHRERVIGSTILPLTNIRYVEEIFTLQLWRPSGRAQGLLRVSSRIDYYTTTTTSNQHFPSSSSAAADASSYPQLDCVVTGIPVVVESNSLLLDETVVSGPTTTHVVPVPSAPPLLPVTTTTMSPTSEQVQTTQNQTTPMLVPVQVAEESNVLRSVLIGFLGGAVAVATVLIGGGGTTD